MDRPAVQGPGFWPFPGLHWLTHLFVPRPIAALWGEQGKKPLGLIPCKTPGIKGDSMATHCVSRSALLSSKIFCRPAEAELLWEPPAALPQALHAGSGTAREDAAPTHKHIHVDRHV